MTNRPARSADDLRRLELLVDEHHDVVRRYVRRRTDPHSVDDAVADTFLVAWRRIDDVPSDARPWLLGVARKVLANQRRAARRLELLRLRLGELERPFSENVEGLDRPIGHALDRLSAKDREALLLVVVEELTTDEAAKHVGVPPGTFRSRLTRAKRRLARALEQVERDERAAKRKSQLNDAKETT